MENRTLTEYPRWRILITPSSWIVDWTVAFEAETGPPGIVLRELLSLRLNRHVNPQWGCNDSVFVNYSIKQSAVPLLILEPCVLSFFPSFFRTNVEETSIRNIVSTLLCVCFFQYIYIYKYTLLNNSLFGREKIKERKSIHLTYFFFFYFHNFNVQVLLWIMTVILLEKNSICALLGIISMIVYILFNNNNKKKKQFIPFRIKIDPNSIIHFCFYLE